MNTRISKFFILSASLLGHAFFSTSLNASLYSNGNLSVSFNPTTLNFNVYFAGNIVNTIPVLDDLANSSPNSPIVQAAYYGNFYATNFYSSFPIPQDNTRNGVLRIDPHQILLADSASDQAMLGTSSCNPIRKSYPGWYGSQSPRFSNGISVDAGKTFATLLTTNPGLIGGSDGGFTGWWWCYCYFNRLFGDPACGYAKDMIVLYSIGTTLYAVKCDSYGFVPALTTAGTIIFNYQPQPQATKELTSEQKHAQDKQKNAALIQTCASKAYFITHHGETDGNDDETIGQWNRACDSLRNQFVPNTFDTYTLCDKIKNCVNPNGQFNQDNFTQLLTLINAVTMQDATAADVDPITNNYHDLGILLGYSNW